MVSVLTLLPPPPITSARSLDYMHSAHHKDSMYIMTLGNCNATTHPLPPTHEFTQIEKITREFVHMKNVHCQQNRNSGQTCESKKDEFLNVQKVKTLALAFILKKECVLPGSRQKVWAQLTPGCYCLYCERLSISGETLL